MPSWRNDTQPPDGVPHAQIQAERRPHVLVGGELTITRSASQMTVASPTRVTITLSVDGIAGVARVV